MLRLQETTALMRAKKAARATMRPITPPSRHEQKMAPTRPLLPTSRRQYLASMNRSICLSLSRHRCCSSGSSVAAAVFAPTLADTSEGFRKRKLSLKKAAARRRQDRPPCEARNLTLASTSRSYAMRRNAAPSGEPSKPPMTSKPSIFSSLLPPAAALVRPPGGGSAFHAARKLPSGAAAAFAVSPLPSSPARRASRRSQRSLPPSASTVSLIACRAALVRGERARRTAIGRAAV
mmetsp:Transcript_38958/g.125116  ORF Transcript_38958/g.125116 Transcript_38958/m.125116 type:complete len:235 (-) Transcript_38958:2922-3626(-)